MQFQVDQVDHEVDHDFERSLRNRTHMPEYLSTEKNFLFTTRYKDKTIAVKMAIDKNSKALQQEAEILKSLSHPNIVKFYAYSKQADALGIEYLDDYDLYTVIYKDPDPYNLSEHQLKYTLHCVASSLAYLHGQNIIFNDLKPENIFMGGWSRGGNGQVKIGDFDQALKLERGETKRRLGFFRGTPAYMSPEMITTHDASKAGDVYSFACVVYELMKQMQVFSGTFSDEREILACNGRNMSVAQKQSLHTRSLLQAVKAGFRAPWMYSEASPLGLEYTFKVSYPEIVLDNETKDLIDACWPQEAALRLSMEQVLAHGFFGPLSAQAMTPLATDNVAKTSFNQTKKSPGAL